MGEGMARNDGRAPEQPRPLRIERGAAEYAEGSCLISVGRTRGWGRMGGGRGGVLGGGAGGGGGPGGGGGRGGGGVRGESWMRRRAPNPRSRRERDKVGGRTQEIQRLIGRSLRSCVDMAA